MKFELHITCSKDISELNINFTDGTSAIVERPSEDNGPDRREISKKEDFLDTDVEFGQVRQEILDKPDTSLKDRDVKVANELQNFEM